MELKLPYSLTVLLKKKSALQLYVIHSDVGNIKTKNDTEHNTVPMHFVKSR